MSALRELAASLGGEAYSAVAVSAWGKWKTASQVGALLLTWMTHACQDMMILISFLIACKCFAYLYAGAPGRICRPKKH